MQTSVSELQAKVLTIQESAKEIIAPEPVKEMTVPETISEAEALVPAQAEEEEEEDVIILKEIPAPSSSLKEMADKQQAELQKIKSEAQKISIPPVKVTFKRKRTGSSSIGTSSTSSKPLSPSQVLVTDAEAEAAA